MADILQVKVIFMWGIFQDMVLRNYIVLAQMQKQDFGLKIIWLVKMKLGNFYMIETYP